MSNNSGNKIIVRGRCGSGWGTGCAGGSGGNWSGFGGGFNDFRLGVAVPVVIKGDEIFLKGSGFLVAIFIGNIFNCYQSAIGINITVKMEIIFYIQI